jgi:predicted glycosyl hydrolase (DUF1957 family)
VKTKTKYVESKYYPRVYKDDEIDRKLIESIETQIGYGINEIINSRITHSTLGNVLQYLEDFNIPIDGYVFLRTQSGGYWVSESDYKKGKK